MLGSQLVRFASPLGLVLNFSNTCAELLDIVDQRFDSLGPQSEFFQQANTTATATSQVSPGLSSHLLVGTLRESGNKIFTIPLQQNFHRRQVMTDTTKDLLLFQSVGDGHLNGTVKRQLAAMNTLENLERKLNNVIAFQQPGAELTTGLLNSLGKCNLLRTSQQWDLAHLC